MVYWIMFFATICLLGIYIKDTSYVNYLHHCIDDLELANKHLRENNNLLKEIANEQNTGMVNFIAGRNEEAFENFQNVKDEIERLANEEELDTHNNSENV